MHAILSRAALRAGLFLCLFTVGSVHAQGITGGEFSRAMRPGAYVPYDGASFSHRYQFDNGPGLFLGVNSQQLYYLDYLDRLDRAERFGYRRPPLPRQLRPCYQSPSPRVRIYYGVGIPLR